MSLDSYQIPQHEIDVRTDPEQFRQEDPAIAELYDFVTYNFCVSGGEQEDMLAVFNNAYYICWLVAEKQMSYDELCCEISRPYNYRLFFDFSLCVASIVLYLHEDMIPHVGGTAREIRKRCEHLKVHKELFSFLNSMQKLQKRINFRYIESANAPEEPMNSLTVDEKYPLSCEALQKVADMLGVMQELEAANMRMKQQLKEEKGKSQKQIEKLKKEKRKLTNDKLDCQAQIEQLKQELEALKNDATKGEAEAADKKAGKADDGLASVINLDTVLEHAKDLSDASKVDAIIEMLNDISVNKDCSDKRIKASVKALKKHAKELRNPQRPTVNNFNEGSAYNDIHENNNTKINTHGRR